MREDDPTECTALVDIDGQDAHCIRETGHSGPHAAGISLEDADVCGEVERGYGRTCLRLPHSQWPDAHDYGEETPNSRNPPAWWFEQYGYESWPVGPAGFPPDQPAWFYKPSRPTNDPETITNHHDTDEVVSLRHKGGGFGTSDGGDELSSVGDVRAMIDRGVEHHGHAQLAAARANEGVDATRGTLATAIGTAGEMAGRIAQLATQIDQMHNVLNALETAEGDRMPRDVEQASGAASESANSAEQVFGLAQQGSGSEMLLAAISMTAVTRVSFDEATSGVVILYDRLSEARFRLAQASEALRQIVIPVEELKEGASVMAKVQSSLEDGYRASLTAVEHANTYAATL